MERPIQGQDGQEAKAAQKDPPISSKIRKRKKRRSGRTEGDRSSGSVRTNNNQPSRGTLK